MNFWTNLLRNQKNQLALFAHLKKFKDLEIQALFFWVNIHVKSEYYVSMKAQEFCKILEVKITQQIFICLT